MSRRILVDVILIFKHQHFSAKPRKTKVFLGYSTLFQALADRTTEIVAAHVHSVTMALTTQLQLSNLATNTKKNPLDCILANRSSLFRLVVPNQFPPQAHPRPSRGAIQHESTNQFHTILAEIGPRTNPSFIHMRIDWTIHRRIGGTSCPKST